MAFVNMFNDRVEQFNLREENERLAELFSDEKLQEEAQWQAYSVKEISRLFSISEEEALKLIAAYSKHTESATNTELQRKALKKIRKSSRQFLHIRTKRQCLYPT